jgi:ribose transport system permease protein
MSGLLTTTRRNPGLLIVAGLALGLLLVNVALSPVMLDRGQLPSTINLVVPSLLVAMASVPSVMTGRGGIDLSVGPLLGLTNVVLVGVLLAGGLGAAGVAIPVCLAMGAAIGALNGALVAYGRLQPVVVTLGAYLVLSGITLVVMPEPVGDAPGWTSWLAGSWLGGYLPRSLLLVLVAGLVWVVLRRLGVIGLFLAVGSDDRAAYTSGVRVRWVLVGAYLLGGVFAALAGIALTVLIQSGDPLIGRQYTLAAIAAVALGGNPLFGGRGTLVGPVLGAVSLFLMQTLMSTLNVSSLWIQVVYGLVLLAAVCANASLTMRLSRPVPGGAT